LIDDVRSTANLCDLHYNTLVYLLLNKFFLFFEIEKLFTHFYFPTFHWMKFNLHCVLDSLEFAIVIFVMLILVHGDCFSTTISQQVYWYVVVLTSVISTRI